MSDKLTRESAKVGSDLCMSYDEELGTETVDKIMRSVANSGGDVVDLGKALGREKTRRALEAAPDDVDDEAEAELDRRFSEKLDAAFEERGFNRQVDHEPEPEKSDYEPVTDENTTYEMASAMYGRGEIDRHEFEPFRRQHETERRRR